MTSHNGYVWITVDLPEQSIGPVTWYQNDSDDEVALEAFGSLIQMITCFDHDPEANRLLKGRIRRKAGEMYGYRYAPDREPSEFATSSYLITKMLASVVNDSIQRGLDISNGRLLAHQFLNTTYTAGPIGRLFIDSFGERQSKICLSPFNHSHGRFTRALYYDHTETTLQRVPNTVIVWNTPGNRPPRDTPLCGFLGDGESCRKSPITPVIIGMAILILLFTSFLWRPQHGKRILRTCRQNNKYSTGDMQCCERFSTIMAYRVSVLMEFCKKNPSITGKLVRTKTPYGRTRGSFRILKGRIKNPSR
ncbi:hypothetical protein BV898_18483 [Hypsibius exemplaris]|uniref:Receptor ligand binding region domain-containing protein n=1 Tax=Hypsibius exemplaris TaxID=2072580 RepID=A0A9X6NHU8_HYPEX|nr:hypothetical protein BV898_18483 [Hypsibius exemplaris]